MIEERIQHLYLINTWCKDRYYTYVWSTHDAKNGTAITSDQHMMQRKAEHLHLINTWCEEWLSIYIHPVREHIPLLMEGLCTHIWSWGNTSQQSYQNGPQSSSTDLPSNWPGASIVLENGSCPYIRPTRWNGQHSHLTWKELNPLAMTEWFSPYIWSSGNTSLYHIRMATQSRTECSW